MRTWLCVAALLILPLLVYWPTVTHEYGFRDDYAHLREVRERPGWLTTLTTAHGRPVYGAALEASLQSVDRVMELTTLRTISALLIGVVGVLLWWQLRRSGWTRRCRPRRSAPPSRCCRERKSSSAGPLRGRSRSGWSRRSRGLRSWSAASRRTGLARAALVAAGGAALRDCGHHVSDERAVRGRAARGRLVAA